MADDTLQIHNASLPGSSEPATIAVRDGQIQAIDATPANTATVIDAEGGLVAPTFVDPHTHLDKAMVLEQIEVGTGDLEAAVKAMRSQKKETTVKDVQKRAEKATELHLEHGCTQIRTHVDVDTVGGLTGLKGVTAARDTYADMLDIEIVAFPQEGLFTDDGSLQLIAEALDRGADVVGGIPAFEESIEDKHRHIDAVLELAVDRSLPVDMHIDETLDPGSRTLEYLAERTQELGLDNGSVTASHACALAAYPDTYAEQVIEQVAEAGINIITNPGTNLLLQGRDANHPRPRGLTRVDELRDAGVTVAAGQDNMQDGFYPYGEGNMLEVGRLLSHAAHMDSPTDQDAIIDMVTTAAGDILSGQGPALKTGEPAAFNVFPPAITSVTDALREAPRPRHTVHNGKIVKV